MSKSQDQTGPYLFKVIYSPDNEQLGRSYPLDPSIGVITIGRSSESTLVLTRDSVSRRHAGVEFREDGFWLIDNASDN
ncbi:MAG TPA: FHA domain-containing protein, partial [Polyangium sp.]|nr:FHA domain-containing protein [Polyangium sp.]